MYKLSASLAQDVLSLGQKLRLLRARLSAAYVLMLYIVLGAKFEADYVQTVCSMSPQAIYCARVKFDADYVQTVCKLFPI